VVVGHGIIEIVLLLLSVFGLGHVRTRMRGGVDWERNLRFNLGFAEYHYE
jgi:hypothetical protein